MNGKVSGLLKSSRHVIRDALLENGALVAANTDIRHYPRNVSNYHFVWPRDAMLNHTRLEKRGRLAASYLLVLRCA